MAYLAELLWYFLFLHIDAAEVKGQTQFSLKCR